MSLARLKVLLGFDGRADAGGDRKHVAAVDTAYTIAVLLIEVAWADHQVSEQERRVAASALCGLTGLDEDEVAHALERAEAHIAEQVGVIEFTRELMTRWSYSQRCALIEALWRVALADTEVTPVEEGRIRHISDLLYIEHGDFINAKLSARDES